jgi:hypothetical protein
MLKYLPHGPDRYWYPQICRLGVYRLIAVRLIGRLYWTRDYTRMGW